MGQSEWGVKIRSAGGEPCPRRFCEAQPWAGWELGLWSHWVCGANGIAGGLLRGQHDAGNHSGAEGEVFLKCQPPGFHRLPAEIHPQTQLESTWAGMALGEHPLCDPQALSCCWDRQSVLGTGLPVPPSLFRICCSGSKDSLLAISN